MRERFARYVQTLRGWAEADGVTGVPFIVNIHGSGGGRATRFPIGISQLRQAYAQGDGYLPASDLYLNNFIMDNFQDLYLVNAFTRATARTGQATGSIEFQCGDNNYGQNFGERADPASLDMKARMCVAQDNRLINYYAFSGGYNYHLNPPPHDGSDRIAHTGERHGSADLVNPEGGVSYMFAQAARTGTLISAMGGKLAGMAEEHDNVAFSFIPDYFMTESKYPKSKATDAIIANLEQRRAGPAWELLARAMLLSNFRFGALDIQAEALDPAQTPVLVLPSARYMDTALQMKLAGWLRQGGRMLVYGEVPECDGEGAPCDILARALGVRVDGMKRATGRYFLSVAAEGWAAPRWETRVDDAQFFSLGQDAQPLLRICDTGDVCAFETPVGHGRAVVVATPYICDREFFRTALERLGATPGLAHDCPDHGIFMTSTVNDAGERFLHILNMDYFRKSVHLAEAGRPLLDGAEITLQPRAAMMLPLDMTVGPATIMHATAEVTGVAPDSIDFRLTQPRDRIVLRTNRVCVPDSAYDIELKDGLTRVTSTRHALMHDKMTLRFK